MMRGGDLEEDAWLVEENRRERARLEDELAAVETAINRREELYADAVSDLKRRLRQCEQKLQRFTMHTDQWRQWTEKRDRVEQELVETRHEFQAELEDLREERRDLQEQLEALETFEDVLEQDILG